MKEFLESFVHFLWLKSVEQGNMAINNIGMWSMVLAVSTCLFFYFIYNFCALEWIYILWIITDQRKDITLVFFIYRLTHWIYEYLVYSLVNYLRILSLHVTNFSINYIQRLDKTTQRQLFFTNSFFFFHKSVRVILFLWGLLWWGKFCLLTSLPAVYFPAMILKLKLSKSSRLHPSQI